MRKIVPFNNVLTFNTDVNKITAISLEHDLSKEADAISGVFYISGEYRMLNGGLNPEKFNFELPFDIALGSRYQMDSLVVDIDDFRYELVDENKMKINIDLYIDGEETVEEPIVEAGETEVLEEPNVLLERMNGEQDTDVREDTLLSELVVDEDDKQVDEDDSLGEVDSSLEVKDTMEDDIKRESEIFKEMVYDDEKSEHAEVAVDIDNVNNVLNNINGDENYVTYKVYRVVDGDTIDSILTKYKVTKEELFSYNENITEVKVGDKLIIPAK